MVKELIAIVGALGIGGLISSYLTIIWSQRKDISQKRQDTKDVRYKCIILLMQASLDFSSYKEVLNRQNYNLNNEQELSDLLRDEYINALLFASDEFVLKMGSFLQNPSTTTLAVCALAMRKDLYTIRTKLTSEQVARFIT